MNKYDIFYSNNGNNLFFSGIYGCSMYGIAIFCRRLGYNVSGSDTCINNEKKSKLEKLGITVNEEQTEENITSADAYIYSHAISEDNSELRAARQKGIPVYTRSEMLGILLSLFKNRIGVCGTHGKSTVSAMIANILKNADIDFEAFIGADAKMTYDENSIKSESVIKSAAVFEACEYKKAFLDMSPSLAAVLNIEKEHIDTYQNVNDAINAYRKFAEKAETAVICGDSKNCLKIAPYMKKAVFYSLFDSHCDMYGENIRQKNGFYSFDAMFRGKKLFSSELKIPGIHNVSNALCAALVCHVYGIEAEKIRSGIESYCGIKRRFEYIGNCGQSPVFDDYAHHPTEISCTLDAARKLGYKRIVCAFQPHTYSRTKEFFEEFSKVFSEFDYVVFADIYAAREENTFGITSEALASRIKNSVYISDFTKIAKFLKKESAPDTLILTLGAGKMDVVAKMITDQGSSF